ELREWCGRYPNTRLFYIMLHRDALSDNIVEVAEVCDNISVATPVDGAIPEYVDIDVVDLYTSTLTLDEPLYFTTSIKDLPLKAIGSADAPFTAEIAGGMARGELVELHVSVRDKSLDINSLSELIKPECDLEGNYVLHLSIESLDKGVKVLNPAVRVHIANKPLRSMQVMGGEKEELKVGEASWYDSFLWWSASTPDTLEIPLQPRFNEAALSEGASQTFHITVPEDEEDDDFVIIIDGKEYRAGDNFTISTTSAPETAGLVFKPGAKTGKRYVSLLPLAARSDVERLNGQPVEKLTEAGGISLRARYSEDWNPLKWILCIVGAVILGLLILWFCMLRPLRYPKFRTGAVIIEGPGSYYRRVSLRGKRQVVLTPRRRKQGVLNRLFTGEVYYVPDSSWDADITLVPGLKKRVKVRCPQGWSATPTYTLSSGATVQLHSPQGKSSKLSM
ncbi:MAG: hypothetical protein K2K72_05485, partial [Duncaniella sp.]|nr:hypothetical protein [Duncaniella sp.]